ncbi:MAG: ABC transporter ATP-binding protein/permease [Ruminococcus sp.]|nr:ABC transporter ATP-binding protein/permease [Ruminococcus sp.]
MLQIKGIRKVYKTGNLVQEALKGVSLSLRDNEFVAILGPSGSGKTTLLNIIGGLDRYDEGDLIINGISTKKYSDRDWDSYRNHTVGFVFQSYNLIPHQTILKNVELALTISGISSKERTRRATEALEKVGLSEHIHKRPSQMSGGQMQRVAIARALVNDPDILLADEPTGALDSETSLQVMDLLKEVARDRLVVMVTHNPELAETYATRIVNLKDGEITSDTDPYTPKTGEGVHKNMGKASMSFFTALALSFNNLRTKKARTILVAFAGSIGIIGIAMILSMSHGANQYIHNMQEESLQTYPLTISDTNFDLMSMRTGNTGSDSSADDGEKDESKDVTEIRMVSALLGGIKKNDLKSLREYFESKDCDIYDYVQSLEYGYKITPQIYKEFDGEYRQVNPDKTINAMGLSSEENLLTGMVSSFSTTNTFNALPAEPKLYTDSYALKSGKWPEKYDECVVVLMRNGRVPDIILYDLGMKDPTELDKLLQAYQEGTTTEVNDKPLSFNYEDFLGIEFKLLPATEYYTYDKENKVWTNRSEDNKYMKKVLDKADTIRVVGVVEPSEDSMSAILPLSICYHSSLTDRLIATTGQTEIVKQQVADPKTDVFTGKKFGSKDKNQNVDFSSFFSVDQKAIDKALNFDMSDLKLPDMDLSSLDFSSIDLESALSGMDLSNSFPKLSQDDIEELFKSVNFTITADSMKSLFEELLRGYTDYSKNDARSDLENIPDALSAYITSQDARQILFDTLKEIIAEKSKDMITAEDIAAIIEKVLEGYPQYLLDHELSETIQYLHLADYLRDENTRATIEESIAPLREKLGNLVKQEDVTRVTKALIDGYEPFADENKLPTVASLMKSFAEYLATDKAKALITGAVSDAVDTSAMENTIARYTDLMSAQISGIVREMMGAVSSQISYALESSMASLMGGLSTDLMSGFDFDIKSLSNMIKFNMSAQEMKDLMTSLLSGAESTYDSNLRKLSYADINKPTDITIYPMDYESKNHIKELIEGYNTRAKEAGDDERVIEYTDLVDTLMGTVTTIINVISYLLIAFVAISLVVSSIMIGVITYISVLERRKEIGILRAIGASKHNVSSVFNAETFIIGLLAGVIGIVITEILIIPTNLLIHSVSGQQNINAILPPEAAFILIGLSVVLTLIGGIIPSRKAAKSDPVTALRSE